MRCLRFVSFVGKVNVQLTNSHRIKIYTQKTVYAQKLVTHLKNTMLRRSPLYDSTILLINLNILRKKKTFQKK